MDDGKPTVCDGESEPEKIRYGRTHSNKGILLVPKPSTDPNDPLNWPIWRKHLLFAILCFGTFMGIGSGCAPVLAITAQSETFHKNPQEVSYTTSATIAGLIIGPLIFVPAARLVGMCSVCFWTMVANTAFSAWAGAASGPNDFISYAVARGLGGLMCAIPQVLTGGYIVNVYFRHQRGTMFAIYSTIFTISIVVSESFCGFIVQHSQWPVTFWWLVAGNGLAAILIFLFLEETAYDRSNNQNVNDFEFLRKSRSRSWPRNRWVTFFPGHQVVPHMNLQSFLTYLSSTFIISISPVTILAGLYGCVNFAWWITLQLELSIYLSEPYAPSEGLVGYGFDAQQTAIFFIALWIGVLCAQFLGIAINDRIPLYLTRRRGKFAPEFRLYPAWISGLVITPVGLGLFGASLQYHLHYMVLAVGSALAAFGVIGAVPISINYIVECFPEHPQEVGAAMNMYRLVLALAIPFFFQQWVAKVGFGWVLGTAAFLSIFVFLLVLLLMVKGPWIRKANLIRSDYREGSGEVEGE